MSRRSQQAESTTGSGGRAPATAPAKRRLRGGDLDPSRPGLLRLSEARVALENMSAAQAAANDHDLVTAVCTLSRVHILHWHRSGYTAPPTGRSPVP